MSMQIMVGTRDAGGPKLPEIELLGAAFLGPYALSAFIGALEMGIVITCFMRFLARSEKERMPIKLLVYFVTFVAACVASQSLSTHICICLSDKKFFPSPCNSNRLQTGTTFAAWWKISVQDFGNWVGENHTVVRRNPYFVGSHSFLRFCANLRIVGSCSTWVVSEDSFIASAS
jgi:hypothetical protein